MHIFFLMEGGIAYLPALSQPMEIDTAQLPEAEAQELHRLIEATRFFELPAEASAPRPGAADYFHYKVTVRMGDRQHTIHLAEPIEDEELRKLVSFLRTKSKELRRARQ